MTTKTERNRRQQLAGTGSEEESESEESHPLPPREISADTLRRHEGCFQLSEAPRGHDEHSGESQRATHGASSSSHEWTHRDQALSASHELSQRLITISLKECPLVVKKMNYFTDSYGRWMQVRRSSIRDDDACLRLTMMVTRRPSTLSASAWLSSS